MTVRVRAVGSIGPSYPRRIELRTSGHVLARPSPPSLAGPLALFSAYRASPTCAARGDGAPGGAPTFAPCEGARVLGEGRSPPGAPRRQVYAVCASLTACGDFGPRGRVSVHGIGAVDRAASSSQTARSGRRAGSRGLPGASLRGSPAGAAPNSARRTSPEDAPRRAGIVIGLYSGRRDVELSEGLIMNLFHYARRFRRSSSDLR